MHFNVIPVFIHSFPFSGLFFFYEKFKKSNNLKAKTLKFRMSNSFDRFSNKFTHFLGLENTHFLNKKREINVVFVTFYVFILKNTYFQNLKTLQIH